MPRRIDTTVARRVRWITIRWGLKMRYLIFVIAVMLALADRASAAVVTLVYTGMASGFSNIPVTADGCYSCAFSNVPFTLTYTFNNVPDGATGYANGYPTFPGDLGSPTAFATLSFGEGGGGVPDYANGAFGAENSRSENLCFSHGLTILCTRS
jgi:hypothetical protein